MITIDGSRGEGGGQMLRSALTLSLATQQPVRLENIRARRQRPGLQPQHLAAVNAAAEIGQAKVQGAVIGSTEITFEPSTLAPGEYRFDIGTAGSAPLLLQTLLPALMSARSGSALVMTGGTHNPLAPPFEFLAGTYLPLIQRLGASVKAKLDRHGFYPAGGGKMRVVIEPAEKLGPIELLNRGEVIGIKCVAILASLPRHIAERELKVLKRAFALDTKDIRVEEVKSAGPGNALLIEIEAANVSEVFCGFGELGLRAELVAGRLAKEAARYLDANVPVGEHLADQLLVPMALAGGGAFVTLPLSSHAETNIDVLKKFLPVEVRAAPLTEQSVRVDIRPANAGGLPISST